MKRGTELLKKEDLLVSALITQKSSGKEQTCSHRKSWCWQYFQLNVLIRINVTCFWLPCGCSMSRVQEEQSGLLLKVCILKVIRSPHAQPASAIRCWSAAGTCEVTIELTTTHFTVNMFHLDGNKINLLYFIFFRKNLNETWINK